MRWTDEYKEQIRGKIRLVLVQKPNISKYELARVLGIDKDVALRLKKEVCRESLAKADNQKIMEEMGKLENEYNELAFECWKIIDGEMKVVKNKKGKEIRVIIPIRQKLAAIKTLIDNRKTLFNIKLSSGLFQRKLEKLKPKKELSKEDKKLLEKALEYAMPSKDN